MAAKASKAAPQVCWRPCWAVSNQSSRLGGLCLQPMALRGCHNDHTPLSGCLCAGRRRKATAIDFENLPPLPEDAFKLAVRKEQICVKTLTVKDTLLPEDLHYEVLLCRDPHHTFSCSVMFGVASASSIKC